MDKEHIDAYQKDCENSGNLDYPLAGCILTPLCMICKNYDQKIGSMDSPCCVLYGTIPEEIDRCRKYECKGFIHNPRSKANRDFTKDLKPKRT